MTTASGTVSAQLACFAGGIRSEDIPAEVLERAKYLILDAVGIAWTWMAGLDAVAMNDQNQVGAWYLSEGKVVGREPRPAHWGRAAPPWPDRTPPEGRPTWVRARP